MLLCSLYTGSPSSFPPPILPFPFPIRFLSHNPFCRRRRQTSPVHSTSPPLDLPCTLCRRTSRISNHRSEKIPLVFYECLQRFNSITGAKHWIMAMAGKAREAGVPLMKLVRLRGLPILEQLHLEERLLRTSSDNWCLINDGTSSPAVVMGLSGKLSELVEVKSVLRDHIPIIRRFTGGGTVVVDNGTIFVTLICNKDAVSNVQPFPRSIMSWSGLLYSKVFEGLADFHLRENDYVFGDRKFGGNAQSITKHRWVHHTSFLWDYVGKNMSYLKQPAKAPRYRLTRDHMDFVCGMKEYMPRSEFIERTINAIGTQFSVIPVSMESIDVPSVSEYVHTTRLLTEQEILEAYPSNLKT